MTQLHDLDLYAVLTVDRRANADEIRRAYKKMALRWHPDRNPENRELADKRFKEIAMAFEVLSDPSRRETYDRFGLEGVRCYDAGAASPQSTQRSWRPRREDRPFGCSPFPFSETESLFFGFGGPFPSHPSRRHHRDDALPPFSDPFELFAQFFGRHGGERATLSGPHDAFRSFREEDPFLSFFSNNLEGMMGQQQQQQGWLQDMRTNMPGVQMTSSSSYFSSGFPGRSGGGQSVTTTTVRDQNGQLHTERIERELDARGIVVQERRIPLGQGGQQGGRWIQQQNTGNQQQRWLS